MMQHVHEKLNPGLPWQKQHSVEETTFYQQIGIRFKEETKMLHLEYSLCSTETWTHRKVDQKYLETLKYGARERWSKSVGLIA
jgi:hypothetical protein